MASRCLVTAADYARYFQREPARIVGYIGPSMIVHLSGARGVDGEPNLCAYGCGRPREDGSDYCSDICRILAECDR